MFVLLGVLEEILARYEPDHRNWNKPAHPFCPSYSSVVRVKQMHIGGVTWSCHIIWAYKGEELHQLQLGKCMLFQVLHFILLWRGR